MFRFISILVVFGAAICQLFLAMDALDKLFRFSEGWRIFWKIFLVISFPIFRSVNTGAVFFAYFTGDGPIFSIATFYLVCFFIPLTIVHLYSKNMNISEGGFVSGLLPMATMLYVYYRPWATCVFGVFTAYNLWNLNVFLGILLYAVPMGLMKLLNRYDSEPEI